MFSRKAIRKACKYIPTADTIVEKLNDGEYIANEKIIVNLNDGWLYEGDVKKEKLKCRTYNLFQDFDFNFNFLSVTCLAIEAARAISS